MLGWGLRDGGGRWGAVGGGGGGAGGGLEFGVRPL